MKRAFTVVEILIVICILAILAALSYPAIVEAKKSANKSHCVSNLRQIGVAVTLYRDDHDGATSGTPLQMGFPPHFMYALKRVDEFKCRGNNPNGNGYGPIFEIPQKPERDELWAKYVEKFGSSAVYVFDDNHQASYPRSISWQSWHALGLQLDGAVVSRTKMGRPWTLGWWAK